MFVGKKGGDLLKFMVRCCLQHRLPAQLDWAPFLAALNWKDMET